MKSETHKRILLCGGGTGGHVMPLVAVAEALKKRGDELCWIGDESSTSLSAQMADSLGIAYRGIPAGKWRRYPSLANLLTPWQVLRGVRKAQEILNEFRPTVIFAKGGHVTVPVILAAHRLKIPIVIHESDAVMGWSNRWASRFADKICVAFAPKTYPARFQSKLIETGVPVRLSFVSHHLKQSPSNRPTILVTGGSQGARAINQAITEHLTELLGLANTIHLTGWADYQSYQADKAKGYQVLAWADAEMPELMAQSDLIVSRASATTLAEIAAIGRPAILIPLPLAANNHQQANAQVWEQAGAAIVLEQTRLANELLPTLRELLKDQNRRRIMATKAHQLAQPKAIEKIVAVIDQVSN